MEDDTSKYFCSQLIAVAYQRLGILSVDLPANNYLPYHLAADCLGMLKLGKLGNLKIFEKGSPSVNLTQVPTFTGEAPIKRVSISLDADAHNYNRRQCKKRSRNDLSPFAGNKTRRSRSVDQLWQMSNQARRLLSRRFLGIQRAPDSMCALLSNSEREDREHISRHYTCKEANSFNSKLVGFHSVTTDTMQHENCIHPSLQSHSFNEEQWKDGRSLAFEAPGQLLNQTKKANTCVSGGSGRQKLSSRRKKKTNRVKTGLYPPFDHVLMVEAYASDGSERGWQVSRNYQDFMILKSQVTLLPSTELTHWP